MGVRLYMITCKLRKRMGVGIIFKAKEVCGGRMRGRNTAGGVPGILVIRKLNVDWKKRREGVK